jgi:hypothetical protein
MRMNEKTLKTDLQLVNFPAHFSSWTLVNRALVVGFAKPPSGFSYFEAASNFA